jgi:LPXTG-site transpeptidase (sortase) family protein
VPLVNGTWQVDWLTGVGGWLQETAFPSLRGITGHVVTHHGSDGPFVHLNSLVPGDNINVSVFGCLYIYKGRSVGNVAPDDILVFKHYDDPVLTLVTCSEYDKATQAYDGRFVENAVLVQVNPAGGGR